MPLPVATSLTLHRIYIANGHSYFGRHGQGPANFPMRSVEAVECVANRGLRGDRFFDYKENYKGQVTLFSKEVFDELRRELNLPRAHPAAARRNLLVSGCDLNELVGWQFQIQDVRFEGVGECTPCYWMEQAIGPGAEAWLKGRGGLRCRILTDGWLHAQP